MVPVPRVLCQDGFGSTFASGWSVPALRGRVISCRLSSTWVGGWDDDYVKQYIFNDHSCGFYLMHSKKRLHMRGSTVPKLEGKHVQKCWFCSPGGHRGQPPYNVTQTELEFLIGLKLLLQEFLVFQKEPYVIEWMRSIQHQFSRGSFFRCGPVPVCQSYQSLATE